MLDKGYDIILITYDIITNESQNNESMYISLHTYQIGRFCMLLKYQTASVWLSVGDVRTGYV